MSSVDCRPRADCRGACWTRQRATPVRSGSRRVSCDVSEAATIVANELNGRGVITIEKEGNFKLPFDPYIRVGLIACSTKFFFS